MSAIFNPSDWISSLYLTEAQARQIFLTLAEAANLYVSKSNPVFTAAVSITNATPATSSITGALIVTGGIASNNTTYANAGFFSGKTGATDPGYSFSSSTNSGIGLDAANDVYIRAEGQTGLTVSSTDVVLGKPISITSSSTAISGSGGISIGNNIVTSGGNITATTGRSYAGGGSLALPNFAFTPDVNTGMYNPVDGVVQFVTNGVASASHTSTGSLINKQLSVNTNSIQTNPLAVFDNSASLSTICLLENSNTGASAHCRQLIQTNNAAAIPYLAFSNASVGYTVSMLTGGTLAIGSTATDTGAKTYAFKANSSNIVDLLTSARINNVTVHNVYYEGTTAISGASPLVVSGTTFNCQYSITRIGRLVNLILYASSGFSVTTAGNVLEVDIYTILNSNGMTINSMPKNDATGFMSGDQWFSGSPFTVIRTASNPESCASCYMNSLDGAFSTIRLKIVSGTNFSSGSGNYLYGGSIEWHCRGDAI